MLRFFVCLVLVVFVVCAVYCFCLDAFDLHGLVCLVVDYGYCFDVFLSGCLWVYLLLWCFCLMMWLFFVIVLFDCLCFIGGYLVAVLMFSVCLFTWLLLWDCV